MLKEIQGLYRQWRKTKVFKISVRINNIVCVLNTKIHTVVNIQSYSLKVSLPVIMLMSLFMFLCILRTLFIIVTYLVDVLNKK